MSDDALLVLGCGFTGSEAARLARERGLRAVGTTRDEARARGDGDGVLACVPRLDAASLDALCDARNVDPARARVLVGFAPDDEGTDAAVAAWLALRRPAAVAYVSSTGVYGDARGRVDEDTPVDRSTPRARARLEAEDRYRAAADALVLRAAGIYGPGRGVHLRVARGLFRLTGDGSSVVSRVHVHDLARLALGALERVARAPEGASSNERVFVVADDAPVPQREALAWLSARLGVPLPPSAAPHEVSETLRHDRSACSARLQAFTGLALRYPSYREGFAHCLEADKLLAS